MEENWMSRQQRLPSALPRPVAGIVPPPDQTPAD